MRVSPTKDIKIDQEGTASRAYGLSAKMGASCFVYEEDELVRDRVERVSDPLPFLLSDAAEFWGLMFTISFFHLGISCAFTFIQVFLLLVLAYNFEEDRCLARMY